MADIEGAAAFVREDKKNSFYRVLGLEQAIGVIDRLAGAPRANLRRLIALQEAKASIVAARDEVIAYIHAEHSVGDTATGEVVEV